MIWVGACVMDGAFRRYIMTAIYESELMEYCNHLVYSQL